MPIREEAELAAFVSPVRLRIALVVHDLRDFGGHSLYTKVLANELSKEHDVTVFANSFEGSGDAAWDFRHVRAWRACALASVQTFPLGLRAQKAALAGYSIRHTQGYCGGDPNVVTAHICVAAYLDSLRNVSLRNRLSLRLMAAAESRFYRRYEGQVIAVSKKVAVELQQFYGVSGDSIRVIPHGVDPARFNRHNREHHREAMRRQLGIDEHQTMALYVGDLTKAHSHLKELSAAAPDVQFVIVTSSRAYHWSHPNVQIFPATPAIERYYAAADALVFPTTYDAFGMVLLEAMAAGLAVFSSDQAGAAELIDPSNDGFVTPLVEWVEATASQLHNPELLERVGVAAEQTACKHEWGSVVTAVERLYHETIAA